METNDNKTKVINEGDGKKSGTSAKRVAATLAVGAVAATAGVLGDSLLNSDVPDVPVLDTEALPGFNHHDETHDDGKDDQKEDDMQNAATANAAAVHVNSEPQPMDHTQSTPEVHETVAAHDDLTMQDPEVSHEMTGHTDGLANVDPDVIAADITHGELVDPTDNDSPDLAIADVGTIETPDGQELSAASLTGDNGEQLYMVDIDGDHNYDVVVDDHGSVVAEVPGTMSESDAQSIHDADSHDTSHYEAHDADEGHHDTGEDMSGDIDLLA